MDFAAVDATIQAIIGRSDFVGGIDNEALDFSQLEAFINSGDGSPEGHTGPASYFADSLQADNTVVVNGGGNNGAPGPPGPPGGPQQPNTNPGNNGTQSPTGNNVGRGKLVNVIIDTKRQGHHLPESPPDSGSEHPYSPAETTDPHPQQLATDIALTNGIYTTLSRVTNPTNTNPTMQQTNGTTLFKHHSQQPNSNQQVNNNNGEMINQMLSAPDHILLGNHPTQHHQILTLGNTPQTVNRCLETSQGCVLIQTPATDVQSHHLLQPASRRDPNIVDIGQNRNDYNRTDFKLPLGHDLDTVMMQQTPVGPRTPRRDSNLTELSQNRNDYNSNRTDLKMTFSTHDLDSVMIQSPMGPRVTIGAPLSHSQMDANLENMQAVYTNLQNVSKKRKLSQDIPLVKSEPELSPDCGSRPTACSPMDPAEEYSLDVSVSASGADSSGGPGSTNGNLYGDGSYQCIQFKEFQEGSWHFLADHQKNILPIPFYKVDADKGFNFSNADDAFVCQKKNHFQITCQIQLRGDAKFVKVNEGHYEEIVSFHLHFYGVKYESPDQEIKVEQSQSDRSKKPFYPVFVDLSTDRITKVTVGRLHFSETTSNNMRKKGKPNPEQRYFQLVVGLYAHISADPKVKPYPITLLASNRIIVRASNPGQFESDIEPCWQKGSTNESIYHAGKVGINTDRPDEALVVHGNLKLTGHIVQPSDLRAKQNIKECDTSEQLEIVKNLRLVRYEYQPEFALYSGMSRKPDHVDIGVIAQEVAQVLPEAVSAAGSIILPNGKSIDNFLVVNKERIFMESVGAVKELCKVTNNLENRIDQLERMNKRLNKFKRGDSLKSTASTVTTNGKTQHNHFHTQKCYVKQHKCSKRDEPEDEICSNNVIQITIVVLVIIMALCLAAITTLYFIELQNHNHKYYDRLSKNFNKMQTSPSLTEQPFTSVTNSLLNLGVSYLSQRNTVTNTKILQKTRPWIKDNEIININSNQEDEIRTRAPNIYSTESSNSLSQNLNVPRTPMAIGRPSFCNSDLELEGSSNCQVYCCSQDSIDTHSGENIELDDERQANDKNFTDLSLINNKEKIPKSIHVNNISRKEIRERRDTDDKYSDWSDIYSDSESSENFFSVIIQGRHFNASLGADYCYDCNLPMNLTYNVPISKYMSEDYIYINFQNTHANIRELEFCYNTAQHSDCGVQQNDWNEQQQISQTKNTKELLLSQIDEKNGFRTHGRRFEIDMIGVFRKILTYRASLLTNNQNVCDLPASKLGINFLEYNFNFYRDCDE
ncbi:myelin regulatory factor homolog 2 isoform X2 [Chrysoperla carnea]|uniref:myelin regulatory factor homolog 2 isoform X2 n=1 Tax=Chrysoperla carnea TaxID=189513 RepID=UPI001D07A6A4|nr:myelin regulatory factor homolog 2 isoform X2 [Chrysoperla carnea]